MLNDAATTPTHLGISIHTLHALRQHQLPTRGMDGGICTEAVVEEEEMATVGVTIVILWGIVVGHMVQTVQIAQVAVTADVIFNLNVKCFDALAPVQASLILLLSW